MTTNIQDLIKELRSYLWFALSRKDLGSEEIHVMVTPFNSAGLIEEAAKTLERIQPVIEALTWYADENNWQTSGYSESPCYSEATVDEGYKAKQALEGWRKICK